MTTSLRLAAQELNNSKKISSPKDTLDIYKRIKKTAFKHKFTRFLYSTVFIDPAPLRYEKKPLSDAQKKKDPVLAFEGKTIRNIQILVMDPFGYSANDTSRTTINDLQKIGNVLHVVSQKRVVNNRLLFKQNDKLDLLKIMESERLLRTAEFINDAKIYVKAIANISDSIDITIIVHDKWTLDPTFSIGTTRGKLRLRDKNLAGLGHTMQQTFAYDKTNGMDYRGNYFISNIKNTYVSGNLFYITNQQFKQTGIQLDRPFYSILTKFAGGLSISKTWGEFIYGDTIQFSHKLNYTHMDQWVAKSYRLNYKKSVKQSGPRIIGAFRYSEQRYQLRPSFDIDTLKTNASNFLYLGSTGINFRKYYKDQYIYRFGANEDVPEGFLLQLLYGFYRKEFDGLFRYTGIEISQGKHFKKVGYFSANATLGTLHKKGLPDNSTFRAGLSYFSNLSLERRWYIRQFLNARYVKGFNKSQYERLTLRNSEMFGFNSNNLQGTSKILINSSTVLYAPYNLVGFKFAPVFFMGLGMLQTTQKTVFRSPVYQAYAIGLLIRNESLLNSSFEITFGMYPNIPGQYGVEFKLNPITSFTLKIASFELKKPEMVAFD